MGGAGIDDNPTKFLAKRIFREYVLRRSKFQVDDGAIT